MQHKKFGGRGRRLCNSKNYFKCPAHADWTIRGVGILRQGLSQNVTENWDQIVVISAILWKFTKFRELTHRGSVCRRFRRVEFSLFRAWCELTATIRIADENLTHGRSLRCADMVLSQKCLPEMWRKISGIRQSFEMLFFSNLHWIVR